MHVNANITRFIIRKYMAFIDWAAIRLKCPKSFYEEKLFRWIDFSCPVAVSALSNTDGAYFPNLLFEEMWNVNKLIMSLSSLRVTCDIHSVVTAAEIHQVVSNIWQSYFSCYLILFMLTYANLFLTIHIIQMYSADSLIISEQVLARCTTSA